MAACPSSAFNTSSYLVLQIVGINNEDRCFVAVLVSGHFIVYCNSHRHVRNSVAVSVWERSVRMITGSIALEFWNRTFVGVALKTATTQFFYKLVER